MILTGQLMRNVTSDKIIPLIRNNTSEDVLPNFLSTRLYLDFRNDDNFESNYAQLIREIHGLQMVARPELGSNPFVSQLPEIEPRLSFSAERYFSPAPSGVVRFDCSNNNGHYVVGTGDIRFETAWSGPHPTSIIAYNDPPSIRTISLAAGMKSIAEITDATIFDTSSRTRRPQVGEIVIWQNTLGYFMATKIEQVQARSNGASTDELTFSYAIATDKSTNFRSAV